MINENTAEIESTLKELAQGGYDLIGDVMLLDCVLTCQAILERHHSNQMLDLLRTRLLDTLENHTTDLAALTVIACKQMALVDGTE